MKTNIFSVKKKTQSKIIIEEERTKNPFLLFFLRYKKFILISIFLLALCLFLVSAGVALSLFQGTGDFDISYLNDTSDEIVSNPDPGITDDDVKEELLGEIARKQGVVILVETFMTSHNDVVYYFSDKTTIIVTADGKIYRVSSDKNGNYGVDRNGNISGSAKKSLVKGNVVTLNDGTIITYYSDGTAKVEHKDITIFVRDSNNIELNSGTSFKKALPSGVAISDRVVNTNNKSMTTYTDNTKYVHDNNDKYIVNPNAEASSVNGDITYDKKNSFGVLEEKKLKDGNTVTYFENGSAVIEDEDGYNIYVKKSGDIIIKDDEVYEIVPNKYGYSKKKFRCGDGKTVTYYDNGAAVIEDTNGKKTYVEDSDDIVYDNNNNIEGNPGGSAQKSFKKTTDGKDVVNFENGKSQVMDEDGSSIIVDTSDLTFAPDGTVNTDNITKPSDNGKDKDKEDDSDEDDPLGGVEVGDANHWYEDDRLKNKQHSDFIIKNDSNKLKKFRIVIEEVSDYSKYNITRLQPKFVKFQATVEDSYIGPMNLDNKTWNDENGKVTYVLYDGTLKAHASNSISVSLYIDYAQLSNSEQNKAFIGTIKVYVNE